VLLPFVLEEHHRDVLSIIQLYFELQFMWIQQKPILEANTPQIRCLAVIFSVMGQHIVRCLRDIQLLSSSFC